eukprot:CAMPEP_0202018098 /NCGR_PEP_ID=MMETSP0905-20130828/38666_1 /ASSEMBLY_ACC=CAM_ASM_000554 /TAXON_ID=420261 /ORGANISM="Thalassiosira antarctica, Strain CCMP982" /LENGTH=43 /DNA_ID= /DNA_START= /DNA_END= /DNA_ORIENTATION=
MSMKRKQRDWDTEGQKEDGGDGTSVLPCCTFNGEEDDEVEKVS